MAFHRWLYRGGHPNLLAKIINWPSAIVNSLGILPEGFVTLEVIGRKSGKTIKFPLAMVVRQGDRYLVSMLGKESNWVKNVRAANGKAVLVHGSREKVQLNEIEDDKKAPILKAYLQLAPGARPHFPVHVDAPIAKFEKIPSEYPVFKIEKE
jgi:deazaflavin-dependent oxidoreductase (nitroreductase family)